MQSEQGYFITFEGGEGAGKTTQINRLAKMLTDLGHKVVTTREPGGTDEAEAIRNLLVQRDGGEWSAMAEVLLLYAARVMHIEKRIQPALNKGCIVLCDRFSDSTMAYQGYGYGMDLQRIKEIEKTSIDDFKPDVTLIFDIDVKGGIERSTKRLSAEKGFEKTEDKFERMDITFHEKLRRGFLSIAKEEPQRCTVIDASKSIDDVTQSIKEIILPKLKASV